MQMCPILLFYMHNRVTAFLFPKYDPNDDLIPICKKFKH